MDAHERDHPERAEGSSRAQRPAAAARRAPGLGDQALPARERRAHPDRGDRAADRGAQPGRRDRRLLPPGRAQRGRRPVPARAARSRRRLGARADHRALRGHRHRAPRSVPRAGRRARRLPRRRLRARARLRSARGRRQRLVRPARGPRGRAVGDPGGAAAAADRARPRRRDAAARHAGGRDARPRVGSRQPGGRARRADGRRRRDARHAARVRARRGPRAEGADDPLARDRPALGGARGHRRVRGVLRRRRAAGGRGRVSRKARAALRGPMTVRAITIDFWGTLLFDPPSSDNRYKMRRMKDFETILAGAGARASAASLDRAYEESASHLGRVWATHRDVPVQDHVRAILSGVDRALAARLPADVMTALVDAYARPILMVPPAVDDGALKALRKLCDLGYTLAVVSNTMRTPGATLRRVLEHYGLLGCFSHTAFSDETGVRKPDAAIFLGALRALGG